MTENKRFTIEIIEDKDVFIQQKGANHYLGVNGYVNGGMVVDLLNELNDENINIKKRLNEEYENCIYYSHKKVMTAINDAIATERTSIGKSVLKQLKEQIT